MFEPTPPPDHRAEALLGRTAPRPDELPAAAALRYRDERGSAVSTQGNEGEERMTIRRFEPGPN
ncbi:MAG: hypothetical protein WBE98_04790, partial [Gammaproteobacteria bacterium]